MKQSVQKAQTIQPIADLLFDEFKHFFFGSPFNKKLTGFIGNTLVQPIKIDGQHLAVALHHDMYVSSCMLIGGSLNEERLQRRQIAFISFAGKVEGLVGKEKFKNRIYHDSNGKINADQQESFLHVTALAMNRLDILDRNRPKNLRNELDIAEVPVLVPIPDKLPKDLSSILMSF